MTNRIFDPKIKNGVQHEHITKESCKQRRTTTMNKDKKMNREFVTKEYSKFKKTKGNRPIDPTHVARIKKSIAAKDLKLPIYVCEEEGSLRIREGHHTFEARKELGLEIYYIVTDSNDALDMAIFNAGRKNWSMNNFLNFHCVRNKQDYKILKSKMTQYGMPVAETYYLLLGKATFDKQTLDNFKRGEFKIPAGGISKFDQHAEEMRYVNNVFNDGGKLKRAFIRAYSILKKYPTYDFGRFKIALKTKASKLLAATSSNEFISQFENVYNSGVRDKSKKINLVQFTKDRDFEDKETPTIN